MGCTVKSACDKALQDVVEELSGQGQRMMSVDVEMHSRRLEQSRSRNLVEAPLAADTLSDFPDKVGVVERHLEDGPGESSIAGCNCNCSHFGLLLRSRGILAGKNRKTATTPGRTVERSWKMTLHAVEVAGSEGHRGVEHQRSSCMKLVG